MTPSRRGRSKDQDVTPRSAPPTGPSMEALATAAVAAAAKPAAATVAANAAAAVTPAAADLKPPQQPSTSRQIPPNLNLSNPATPTTPNPALRSPRPPIKSAHFDKLEAEGERDAMVRTLVLQLQKEMQDEIDRLTAAHRKTLAEKDGEFRALSELLAKKREDWALQMAAKQTLIADQQHDIIEYVKQSNESSIVIRSLEDELERQRDENDRLRVELEGFTKPCSSKSLTKPKEKQSAEEDLQILPSTSSTTSNKDSDGFEKPTTNARKTTKRPAPDT